MRLQRSLVTLALALAVGCSRSEPPAQSEAAPLAAEPAGKTVAAPPEPEPRELDEPKAVEPATEAVPPAEAPALARPSDDLRNEPARTQPAQLAGQGELEGALGPPGGYALHGSGAAALRGDSALDGNASPKPADPMAMPDEKKPDEPAQARADEEQQAERAAGEAQASERGRTNATAREQLGRFARRDGDVTIGSDGVDPDRFHPPSTVLPRTFYFENTYLGGSAAYAERLRRLDASLGEGERHYRRVQAEAQPFDPPERDGLAVTASVDATHIENAQRVFLQIGLRGSDRYGWRRPPLDLVIVVDQAAFARGNDFVTGFIADVMRKLETADRLGIVVADREAAAFLDLDRIAIAQQQIARRIDSMSAPTDSDDGALARAMRRAATMLDQASDDEAIVPGTQTVLVLTGGDGAARVTAAAEAAHELTVQGAVTSVFTIDSQEGQWWQVANAGYGNFHRVTTSAFASAVDEELASLARVVARLVRVNVRLGKDVDAIRVLGTRVLEQREVDAVKARELAQDRNLSKTMGIVSDRGEDDDGIQTVIPYFYGDDSHVILIELWVENPGTIADVTVRYKDMVNLDNATARTSVMLGARPQLPTPEQSLIAQNVRGFMLGESLQKAALHVRDGDAAAAERAIEAAGAMAAETNDADRAAVQGLKALVEQPSWQNDARRRDTVEETLLISGQRRVGDTNKNEQR